MFADGKNVKKRRLKRKLKAAASIAVALAAGAFLACQRGSEAIREANTAKPLPKDEMDAGPKDAVASALIPYDAGKNDSAVDVREHRKGMPVPDNLLE